MPAALPLQVYYSVFDLDERYWVYNYNLFYRFRSTAPLCWPSALDTICHVQCHAKA